MTISANTLAAMRLLAVHGVGPAKLLRIYRQANQRSLDLPALLGNPHVLREFFSEAQAQQIETGEPLIAGQVEALTEAGVLALSWLDQAYPENLRARLGGKAPPVLFVRGSASILKDSSVGFCGSRKASPKGLEVAADCSSQLASKGVPIVSGGASGVDIRAHHAALEAGGATVIVLAEGIDSFRIKRELREVWDWKRVAVVSQFSLGSRWSVGNAMQRNWTICGLSRAMILIEARTTGGSIAAGRASISLGIPLFTPMYEGMPATAAGNRELITHGARPIMKAESTRRANMGKVMAVARRNRMNMSISGQDQLRLFHG